MQKMQRRLSLHLASSKIKRSANALLAKKMLMGLPLVTLFGHFETAPFCIRFYTNSQLKCLTERIRFFVLTKPSEVRRTGGTLNGTRQSQSEKDGARIKPF